MRWLSKGMVIAIHGELLVEHGGLDGGFKEGVLESTVARPQQLLSYSDPAPSIYELAASYAFGFAKNHPFSDGNKRIALASVDVFLQLNGYELTATEVDAVDTILQLAAGELNEASLAKWIESNSQAI